MSPLPITSAPTLDAIDRLVAVSLAELNDAVALQTRVDRKYVVDASTLDALLGGLAHRLAALEIDGLRSFAYESVYFDTADLESYRAAAHGRRRRYKVRTRTYVDQRATMLEVKTRGARKATVKTRQHHPYALRHRLDGEAAHFVDTTIGRRGLAATLVPTLSTAYHRSTLADLDDVARLTIDAELRCTRPDGRAVRLDDAFVVETKSSGSPSAADRWLWTHGYRPDKISKFGTGMAALDPSLPANKWHRTLHRHFGVN